ncbi:Glutathione-regulated potassium-efflux system protein KefB [Dyadobacter sp. CECT 9275]|uniref:Glutathione-regulated potassium-efflux system protein KefB n=1 Tax=Dyadobacter helix TaxID=2822344 RepID=A0A916JD56_9BACT|nr:cation:proton antiporter [Dyadobacter sp. CECT 9275]CAG5004275.1 Glutathione-regulated potassium-efflux system protein KefB [Dyadobacter sp. CECT 9275]
MTHVPQLIVDLSLILAMAGIITLIFKKLKQPVVLGYILAGLIVGPNFSVFPTITDIKTIEIWAEIGVIFLLFNLGLEFSFKKLVKVGSTAAITGLFEVGLMLVTGFVTGQLLGWTKTDSLFLGGIIAISSTTIIFRAFEELGLKTQQFTKVVFGILVIEDLTAVLLMVLLSTLSISQQFAGMELLQSILKLFFFLIIWFLGGIFIFPTLLRRYRKLMNDESVLITSIALCFGMVLLVTQAGFSAALGAFIMGSILAETTHAEKIEHLLKPVKDLFGAIFFISVGMLINPALLVEYALPTAILVFVVILGKTLYVTLGALISGQPLKKSMQAGMSLSQIGEFSFIIANLGLSLKVTSNFLYPIAVGVSVLTTFTTPYMMRASEPLYDWLSKMLPERWKVYLNRYSTSTETIVKTTHWNEILKSYAQTVLLNSVVVIGVTLLCSRQLADLLHARVPENYLTNSVMAFITFLLVAPFLWALVFKRSNRKAYSALWLNRKFSRGPLLLLELSRVLIAILLMGYLLSCFFATPTALSVAGGIMAISFLVFYQRLQNFYNKIEDRFLQNLNARELEGSGKSKRILLPWDAHFAFLEVSPDSTLIGKNLQELAIREKFGINVVLIERGSKTIHLPRPTEVLYPYDRIEVIGTDAQLETFRGHVEVSANGDVYLAPVDDIVLEKIEIKSDSRIHGQTIRASQIREKTHCMIVGLERNGERILNPDSNMIIEKQDILWIAGKRDLIKEFLKNKPQTDELEVLAEG